MADRPHLLGFQRAAHLQHDRRGRLGTLEPAQVRAIRHLAASAVNGLKPQRVSIVDETGRLLADGSADQTPGGVTADERKVAFEKEMRERIEVMVTSVVGPGRARVQITADFDFNRITQTSDRFDPEGRVVRSSQTREETLAGGDNPRVRSPSPTNCPAASSVRGDAPASRRATRTASPRKSSTTRSRASPRPR